jgi:hypothetical protein
MYPTSKIPARLEDDFVNSPRSAFEPHRWRKVEGAVHHMFSRLGEVPALVGPARRHWGAA